jgi:uncharacterized protein YbbK (DUF523 family)
MPHLSPSQIDALRAVTTERPLRVLLSACLAGDKCGVDGSSYGEELKVLKLMALPNVKTVRFCPEHFSFGTPRNMPDIHGGNGFDVLDGKARVMTDKGEDWTEGFVRAAHEMLKVAQAAKVDLVILQNMSAACGTQVISEGCRLVPVRKFQKGPGVCTALLMRNGFTVMNVMDERTMELLLRRLDPSHVVDPAAVNYDELEWYRGYFGGRLT